MGLLDKLKPQPRWKHTDAAVRLEGVRELDDPAELASLAEGDADARVRRAAVAKIDDPDVIGRVAAGDADADLRDRAAERLMAIACRGTGAEGSMADVRLMSRAVAALKDSRRLATVAKSDAPDSVRAEALAAVTDERTLGGVARQARHESTALAALKRLTDTGELLDVVLNAGHKTVSLAAFDRLEPSDPTLLGTIELRAQHKAVGRRARAILQGQEAAEAARQAAALDRQRRESNLIDSVEALVDVADSTAMHSELARLTEAWRALGVTETVAAERFEAAAAGVQETLVRRDREAAERADLDRVRAEAIATRQALCDRVETLDGDDVLAQLASLEDEWRALLPIACDGVEASQLSSRFASAVVACKARGEMGVSLMAARGSLETLVAEAESLMSTPDAAGVVDRWQVVSRQAAALDSLLRAASRPADDLRDRLDKVAERFATQTAAEKAEAENEREAVFVRARRLVERTHRASEADTLTLREGERLMRDLGAALDELTAAEATAEMARVAGELRTWQEKIAPRVRELREMDEWRKFANAQRQEQLISMAEAIVASLKSDEESGKASDLPATAKALREFHAEWQLVAEAPRQSAQRLWDRFRTATDLMRTRCEPFFAKRREERETARARRLAIVEESETLAASSEWANASARLQGLQTEWQSLPKPTSDLERELAQRFRAACNTFFVRRREDLADRKKVWNDNLARKEALCERAEQLAESTDWDAAAGEMKKLQAEWKTVGPVRKNKSDLVWTRFRAAADRFFERYHHRHELALASKLSEREAMVIELESLAGMPAADVPGDAAATVQHLRTNWNRAVPIPAPGMKPLADRWQSALAVLLSSHPGLFAGTELDPSAVVARMQKLVARVEGLVSVRRDAPSQNLSPTELLAARLRTALASNAMGGRSPETDKSRSVSDGAKDALTAWQRLPPVRTPEADALAERFGRACSKLGIGDFGRRHDSGRRSNRDSGSRPAEVSTPTHVTEEPEPATV